MPANLPSDYRAAEAALRAARSPKERVAALRRMLSVLPRHKGTDHLQGELRRRIAQETEAWQGRGGGRRAGQATAIRPEGAAQLALLGPANSGKSALHRVWCGSDARVTGNPLATRWPQAGMMPYDGVQFQVIDVPAIDPCLDLPWLPSTLDSADGAIVVIDPSDPEGPERARYLGAHLAGRGIALHGRWPGRAGADGSAPPNSARGLPAVVAATKADLWALGQPDLGASDLAAFLDLAGLNLPGLIVRAEGDADRLRFGAWLVAALGVIRVFTKRPGDAPDWSAPLPLRTGMTVREAAARIHPELPGRVRHARLWHEGLGNPWPVGVGPGPRGRRVGLAHPVADGCVLELLS